MRLDVTYSYSNKLNNMLLKQESLDIKYVEIYCMDQRNHQVESIFSTEEDVLDYLENNKPSDDLRLHKFITNDAMFIDILPELDDPLSSHNLLFTNYKLSIKNILYFYFTLNTKILIVSLAVKQNNLFIAQRYIQYIDFAKKIKDQYTTIINSEIHPVANYVLNGLKPNYLSDQQKTILKYIASGLMNKEISTIAGLSTRTVEKHVSNICKRLNVKNRNQLISRYHFYAVETPVYN